MAYRNNHHKENENARKPLSNEEFLKALDQVS